MHSITAPAIALAALAALPAVSAHGYVSGIVSAGQWYPGGDPVWYYYTDGTKPASAGWYALNQDLGFISPDAYGTSDIACHKSATTGSEFVPVTAGSKITLEWTLWPDSHHGPVIDYIAPYGTSPGSLSFVKIAQTGLIDGSVVPGKYATDQLIANNNSWVTTIPSSLAAGDYVLRHEIIALHSAGNADGAQNYPQCINLRVTGSGSSKPSGEVATKFYTATDPGILVNIYQTLTSYSIPGPALWSGATSKLKRAFKA